MNPEVRQVATAGRRGEGEREVYLFRVKGNSYVNSSEGLLNQHSAAMERVKHSIDGVNCSLI